MGRKPNQPHRFFDWTGGINQFASDLRLNQGEVATQWRDSENVEFYKSGGLAKMHGNQTIVTLPVGSKVLGLYEYRKGSEDNDEAERIPMCVYSDGIQGYLARLDLDNGTYTVLDSGYSPTAKPVFENFINGCVVSDGVQRMCKYDAWQTNAVSRVKGINHKGQTGVFPKALCVAQGRLWGAFENFLYYCAPGNPFDWRTSQIAGYIQDFGGAGNDVTALRKYGEYMSIHRDDYDVSVLGGSTPDTWIIKPYGDRGATSPLGVINFNNKQYFYNNGIFALELGSLNMLQLSKEYSRFIHPVFKDLDTSRFNEIIAVDYPDKQQVWYYFPELTDNAGELGVCWIMDWSDGAKIPAFYKRRGNPITAAMKFKNKIYTGVGNTIRLEDTGTTLDGDVFPGYWYSCWFDFATATLKSIEDMTMVFASDRSNVCDLIFRYDTMTTREKVKHIAGVGAADSFKFGSGSKFGSGYKFPTNKAAIKQLSVPNIFYSLQVGIRSDYDFGFYGFQFGEINAED